MSMIAKASRLNAEREIVSNDISSINKYIALISNNNETNNDSKLSVASLINIAFSLP